MLAKPFTPKRPRVEMVPLIDMFFLLLVFFIFGVFSMTMQQGLIVDLPTADTAVALPQEDTLTISVAADGMLHLDQDPASLPNLPAMLRQRQDRLHDPLVAINADRATIHGTVMAVLDAVRAAGLTRVSLQAVPEPS